MPTIVIIGAGGIGSRHLQSLSKIKIPLQIFVVDPILKALKIAKKMLEESIPPDNHSKHTKYISNIKSIPNDIRLNMAQELIQGKLKRIMADPEIGKLLLNRM